MSRLVESIQTSDDYEIFKEGVETIWKHCKPYLKQHIGHVDRGDYLYSGRSESRNIIKKKVRTNRKPTDTNLEIHKDFDKEFQAQLGWPARSASLFTTGARSDAEEYGRIYLVFPIGNFKYTWSDEVPDLYILLAKKIEQPGGAKGRENNLLQQFVQEIIGGKDVDTEFREYYDHMVREGGKHGYWTYENGDDYYDVPSNIKDYSEALTFLKNYYGSSHKVDSNYIVWHPELDFDDFYYRFFQNWLREREVSVYKEAKEQYDEWIMNIVQTYETKPLKSAIESRNEIMLNCGSWYGLDAQMYEWHLDSYIHKFGVKGHRTDEELFEWWSTK